MGGAGFRFLGQLSKPVDDDLMIQIVFPSCKLRWLGIRIGLETVVGLPCSGDPALLVAVRCEIPWTTAFGG